MSTAQGSLRYDLTTIRAEGASAPHGDVRKFGMSKEGLVARQFLLGVVQTADGTPIYHEVFDGNTAEVTTLEPTLQKVLARYPHIKRLIVVADRGLLSLDNVEALSKLRASDRALEFILAVPGRRYAEFTEVLESFQARVLASESSETIDEALWGAQRLIVAHNRERAREQTALRRQRIAELEARAAQLAGKLDAQDTGQLYRGRKLSDSAAKARFFHEVCEANLARIVRVDLKSDLFAYDIDAQALERAELMDGKLLLVTNVTDLGVEAIVARYKSLADIERGFRVLKSEIEIAPVYHRLPERIRAHASLCFMALILYRVMRQRLKLAGSSLSPRPGGTREVAPPAAPHRAHRRRRARLRDLDHRRRAGRRVGCAQAPETYRQRPDVPAVVANQGCALYESRPRRASCRTRVSLAGHRAPAIADGLRDRRPVASERLDTDRAAVLDGKRGTLGSAGGRGCRAQARPSSLARDAGARDTRPDRLAAWDTRNAERGGRGAGLRFARLRQPARERPMSTPLLGSFERFEDAVGARERLLASGFAPDSVQVRTADDEAGPVQGNFLVGNGREGDSGYEDNFGNPVARGTHVLAVMPGNAAQREQARAVLAQFGAAIVQGAAATESPIGEQSGRFEMNDEKRIERNPPGPGTGNDERASTANPVGTAAGAVGGAATGAALGILGGPLGLVAGAVAGALAGGALGKDQLQAIAREDEYWRQNYAQRPYVKAGSDYEDYALAYRYGYLAYDEYRGRTWDDARADVAAGWQVDRGDSRLSWEEAEPAVRDAWERRAGMKP